LNYANNSRKIKKIKQIKAETGERKGKAERS
jgi:hypothetical protein